MSHVYRDTEEDIKASYRRVHGNYDETHVYIVKTGSKKYTVMAVDTYPEDRQPLASEIIAIEKREDVAEDRAEEWMERHPKGIAGDQSSGGGLFSKLMSVFQSVDDAGTSMVENQREEQS